MSLKRSAHSSSPRSWTVSELGTFYAENRASLVSHANRILKDFSRAEEVVQDALIRVILAAPELESAEHARAYLYKTVENLCIDVFRLENRRPNLMVIDDAFGEVEAALSRDYRDHSEIVSAADDAALIRQAISLLSPAERAALVMWEVEGRSVSEIASELGIEERNVRHTLSRARRSLRKILSEFVVDRERGLTALDLLSTTYRRSVQVAKKSSKAALSIFLVFFAFLGFNSIPNFFSDSMKAEDLVKPSAISSPIAFGADSDQYRNSNAVNDSGLTSEVLPPAKLVKSNNGELENVKATSFKFAGLDKSGVPTGFTITDNSGSLGSLYFKSKEALLSDSGLSISWLSKTSFGAANLFLSQNFIQEAPNPLYDVILSVGMQSSWIPTNSRVISTDLERLPDGNYLLTAVIGVKSAIESTIVIPAVAGGRDLEALPSRVITRVVLNSSKSQILAQAVQVIEKGAN